MSQPRPEHLILCVPESRLHRPDLTDFFDAFLVINYGRLYSGGSCLLAETRAAWERRLRQ